MSTTTIRLPPDLKKRVARAADVVPAVMEVGGVAGASRIVEVVIDRARALEMRSAVRETVARALSEER